MPDAKLFEEEDICMARYRAANALSYEAYLDDFLLLNIVILSFTISMNHSEHRIDASSKENNDSLHHQANPSDLLEHDSDQPQNWSSSRKWIVLITTCYVTFIVGINATALTSAVSETNAVFGLSDEHFPNSVWPVTAWNTGAALAPMVVLPVMEDYGVKPGYVSVYLIFLLFVVPQAVTDKLGTFLICRLIAGCCGGVLQDVMDGIIADLWARPTERSLPVSMYVFALFMGVSIGPVFGGAITTALHWRWILYIELIIYGVSAPAIFVILRETRTQVILSHKRRPQQRFWQRWNYGLGHASSSAPAEGIFKGFSTFLRRNVVRPFFLLTTEPVVFFFTLLSALSYGLLFMATQSVPQVFGVLYDFNEQYAGIIQVSIVIGEVLGFFMCAFIGSPYFAAAAADETQDIDRLRLPEVRLHLAIPASFLGVGGGLFVYGWTAYPNVTFWAPSVGLLLLGLGSTVVMQAIMIYITDAYGRYAGSASAAVCFGENIFAAFLPLASYSMYSMLGFQWASSLLAFLAIALSFAPTILVWKGHNIRQRSPFLRDSSAGP